MKKSPLVVVAVLICGFMACNTALACRYNVRETGFVDLGMEPYRLFIYVDSDTPDETLLDIEELASAELLDTNIMPSLIYVDKDPNNPAMKFHAEWKLDTYPSAVLISPDEASMPPGTGSLEIEIARTGEPFKQTLGNALKRIVTSDVREKIKNTSARAYAVTFVIEGPDPNENATAIEQADSAIETIKSQMDMLPKPIANPPERVVLESGKLEDERILLWSMGLKPADVNVPHAAVIYGRARWIGPMFAGEQVNEFNLSQILYVVGDDCECGLDYRWLQGTMLPMRWGEKAHEIAVESLGFDPENPMVKSEMARILGRGGAFYAASPYGYEELEIEIEAPNDVPAVNEPPEPNITPHAADIPKIAAPNQPAEPNAKPAAITDDQEDDTAPMTTTLYVLGALGIVVVAAGIAIGVKASSK